MQQNGASVIIFCGILIISFYAGTDIAGALEYALEKQKNKLENADILLISDFCDNMNNNQIRKIESSKKNGTLFYGLHIKPKYSYFSKLILNLMDALMKIETTKWTWIREPKDYFITDE